MSVRPTVKVMFITRPDRRPAVVDRVITEDGHPPDDSILQVAEETGRLPAARVTSEPGLPRHVPHESAQQRSTAPSDRSRYRLIVRPIPATETSITNRTLLQASAQTKELRMPGGDAAANGLPWMYRSTFKTCRWSRLETQEAW